MLGFLIQFGELLKGVKLRQTLVTGFSIVIDCCLGLFLLLGDSFHDRGIAGQIALQVFDSVAKVHGMAIRVGAFEHLLQPTKLLIPLPQLLGLQL